MKQIFMWGKSLWTYQSQKEKKLQELQQTVEKKLGCRTMLLSYDIGPLKYKIM